MIIRLSLHYGLLSEPIGQGLGTAGTPPGLGYGNRALSKTASREPEARRTLSAVAYGSWSSAFVASSSGVL